MSLKRSSTEQSSTEGGHSLASEFEEPPPAKMCFLKPSALDKQASLAFAQIHKKDTSASASQFYDSTSEYLKQAPLMQLNFSSPNTTHNRPETNFPPRTLHMENPFLQFDKSSSTLATDAIGTSQSATGFIFGQAISERVVAPPPSTCSQMSGDSESSLPASSTETSAAGDLAASPLETLPEGVGSDSSHNGAPPQQQHSNLFACASTAPPHSSTSPSLGTHSSPTSAEHNSHNEHQSPELGGGTLGGAANKSLADSAKEVLESQHSVACVEEDRERLTGEEDECNVMHAFCKLFVFDGATNTWLQRGTGMLRLNDHISSTDKPGARPEIQSRIVVRTTGTLQLILNTRLFPDMTVEFASKKALRFSALTSEGLKMFLISGTPTDVSRLYSALDCRIQELRAHKVPSPLTTPSPPDHPPPPDGELEAPHTQETSNEEDNLSPAVTQPSPSSHCDEAVPS